ncbi:hypothetical protein FB567DRAFT_611103 [Paraphoma chrysanthemicola]|uniref:Uncharacterized protein n=1 Tax=Paraphoma chrysanthemicola TaxID=798071 RepID=A0A8K0QW63_9PLEO|nr:hypothetical protein FB567DRAFT_611103 [Paraphoma chrysanthemicola]
MSEHRPYSPDLEEIIDRYASPALDSSSPRQSVRPFDTSSRRAEDDDTLPSLPSSPPTSRSKTRRLRHAPTNSAPDRFERRSRASLPTSCRGLGTSPLLPYGLIIENTGTQSLSHRRPVQGNMTSSTPSLHSLSSFWRESTSSLRSKLPGAFPDECVEAGSLSSQLHSSALHADPTPKSDHARDSDEYTETLSKSDSPSLQGELQRASPAEVALRENLTNTTRPPPQNRQTNWASRLFGRREASSACRPLYQSTISDDNASEFEYVEPETASELHEAILARIRARGKDLKSEKNTLTQSLESEPTMLCDDDISMTAHDEDGMGLPADAESMSTGSLTHPASGYDASSSSVRRASYSSTPAASVSDNGDSDLSGLRSSLMDGKEESTEHSCPRTSLAPIVVINNQEPTLMIHQDSLSLASSVVVFEQEPRDITHNLALSPVQVVFADKLIAVMPFRGLGFATANAIIYGFVTLVTLRFIVVNLGADVRTSGLASDIGVAIIAALILCTALHSALGGSLKKTWKDASKSVNEVVGNIRLQMVNVIWKAKEQQE